MSRPFFMTLSMLAAFALPGCGGDDCAPVDFAGGGRCSENGDAIVTCDYSMCIEGPYCYEGWFLRETSCPAYASRCVEGAPHEATCVGEILGTCSAAGLVACEDVFTEIRCASDGKGGLALQRGPCAPGARCTNAQTGCDPRF